MTVVRSNPVVSSLMVTVTPGSVAPSSDVTMPMIEPVVSWA